jgi:predicted DNA-binding protein (MmcQ/YjbR family)
VARSVNEAVREVCLSFPEAQEVVSHGFPDFRVRGKTFASYVVNHHGDGRVALWLNSPAGAQDHYSKSQPRHFFVPPYVGPRGWLGVHLNKGISWQRIASLTRQAYEKVAPPALTKSMGETVKIKLPVAALAAQDINPFESRRGKAVLAGVRKLVADWPEVVADQQFGSPVWRAGKKTFLWVHADRKRRIQIYFRVGVGAQGLMTADERFEIPAYLGHQGWIALDVSKSCDWSHVRGLALGSYRHFALARMLKKLGPEAE